MKVGFGVILSLVILTVLTGFLLSQERVEDDINVMEDSLYSSKKNWRSCLTQEQYEILRLKGTERAFTGEYYDHHEEGTYLCAGCKNELFSSEDKFESGTGWPSFVKPMADANIAEKRDESAGMDRIEITCSKCEGHLGHVFFDGPSSTKMRYCINSAALNFEKKDSL